MAVTVVVVVAVVARAAVGVAEAAFEGGIVPVLVLFRCLVGPQEG